MLIYPDPASIQLQLKQPFCRKKPNISLKGLDPSDLFQTQTAIQWRFQRAESSPVQDAATLQQQLHHGTEETDVTVHVDSHVKWGHVAERFAEVDVTS